jgi:hypothetical protein
MELPRYENIFNKEPKIDKLSDSSFEENARLLIRGYSRFIPSLKTHLVNVGRLTSAELMAYNDSVAQILYGPRILSLFKNGQKDEIIELSKTIKEKLLKPNIEIVKSINFNNLAQLVVRPEARFLTEDIKSFLKERGYEVIAEYPLVINLQQYWIMYNEGFLKSDLSDFPTRTLVYTHGESKVLVLHKKQDDLQGHLNSELKGSAGVRSEQPTLRGTVILNGFEEITKTKKELFYDSIDPLGMYRAIVGGKIESPDPFFLCEDPVLYYAGQGIHLPESHELATNLGVLLSKQKLEELLLRFKKL